jgi:hypothetical protein
MSAQTCCKAASNNNNIPVKNIQRPPGIIKRFIKTLGKIMPGVVLVLMPKCPLCIAYYITVVTGTGVSFTTAKYLRTTLLLLCISSLAYIAITYLQKIYRRYNRYAYPPL